MREVARLPNRQEIEFWLMENDQIFGVEKRVGVLFGKAQPVRVAKDLDPVVREQLLAANGVDADVWDQWDHLVPTEYYPDPDPSFPNAVWKPAVWRPHCQSYDTPSLNLERGTVCVSDGRVEWWEDAIDAIPDEAPVEEVTLTRNGRNEVDKVERRTRG